MNPFWYTPSPIPAATFFPSSRYLDALSNSPKVAIRGVLWKKVFLKISPNSQENTCVRVSFLISCRPENTFFTEHLWTDASNSLGCSFWFLNQIFCLLPCVLFRKGSKVMLSTFFYIFAAMVWFRESLSNDLITFLSFFFCLVLMLQTFPWCTLNLFKFVKCLS